MMGTPFSWTARRVGPPTEASRGRRVTERREDQRLGVAGRAGVPPPRRRHRAMFFRTPC